MSNRFVDAILETHSKWLGYEQGLEYPVADPEILQGGFTEVQ